MPKKVKQDTTAELSEQAEEVVTEDEAESESVRPQMSKFNWALITGLGLAVVIVVVRMAGGGSPDEVAAAVDDAPVIEVNAVGTDVISRVELLCHRAGDHRFRVIKTWHPDETSFNGRFTDSAFQARATYYVRLRQAAPVRDRIAMAWSSPIWVSGKSK